MDTQTQADKIVELNTQQKSSGIPPQNYVVAELPIELTQKLQTTLDTKALLNIFKKGISPIVQVDSICFNYQPQNIKIILGKNQNNQLNYQLTLEEENLGELTITREFAFTDEDIETIEKLLAFLIYPLRNSIYFNQASAAALTDALTECGNRKAMHEDLTKAMDYAKRHQQPLSILMIDADDFKKVNDSLGHQAGDELLKLITETTHDNIRYHDRIYRYGGEEFLVVLPNSDANDAQHIAERARSAIANRKIKHGKDILGITVSIGIACCQPHDTIKSLIKRADDAMYQAKAAGKNSTITA